MLVSWSSRCSATLVESRKLGDISTYIIEHMLDNQEPCAAPAAWHHWMSFSLDSWQHDHQPARPPVCTPMLGRCMGCLAVLQSIICPSLEPRGKLKNWGHTQCLAAPYSTHCSLLCVVQLQISNTICDLLVARIKLQSEHFSNCGLPAWSLRPWISSKGHGVAVHKGIIHSFSESSDCPKILRGIDVSIFSPKEHHLSHKPIFLPGVNGCLTEKITHSQGLHHLCLIKLWVARLNIS